MIILNLELWILIWIKLVNFIALWFPFLSYYIIKYINFIKQKLVKWTINTTITSNRCSSKCKEWIWVMEIQMVVWILSTSIEMELLFLKLLRTLRVLIQMRYMLCKVGYKTKEDQKVKRRWTFRLSWARNTRRN